MAVLDSVRSLNDRVADSRMAASFTLDGPSLFFFFFFQARFIVLEGHSLSYTLMLPVKKKGGQVHSKH